MHIPDYSNPVWITKIPPYWDDTSVTTTKIVGVDLDTKKYNDWFVKEKKEDELRLYLRIPGVQKKDVDISLEKKVLVVTIDLDKDNIVTKPYQRTYRFTLDEDYNILKEDSVSLKDGVLSFVFIQPEENKPVKIKIN
jgi:HSP20 family molecular chaperone IbpA